MPSQYDAISNLLTNMPQGEKVIKNLDKLGQLMNSDEGKQLASALKPEDSSAIKDAISEMMNGKTESAKQVVMSLLSTKEGAQVASKVAEILGE